MGIRESFLKLFRRRESLPSFDGMVRVVRDRSGQAGSYPAGRVSAPSYDLSGGGNSGTRGVVLIPLPATETPEKMDLYRELRDQVPDVSGGVWVWVRMCNSGYDLNVFHRETGEQTFEFDGRLRDLAARLDPNGGMDGLISRQFTSYFTYGAFAGEIILNNARTDIVTVAPIPVRTVRFGYRESDLRESPNSNGSGRARKGVAAGTPLRAFQVVAGGDAIELNPQTFYYYALDPDEDIPYGRSLLSSLPEYTHWQRQVVPAMARAQLNAAWPRLHMTYRPDAQKKGESDQEYKKRIDANFSAIAASLENLDIDTNIATFNNVTLEYKQAPNPTERFYEKFRALEELMITGMHLVPMLLGRSYGPSGTWAEAQGRLMERAAISAQLGGKRMVERVNDLALKLWGYPEYRTQVVFQKTNLQESLKQAQSEQVTFDTGVKMRDEGVINQDQLAARVGLQTAAGKAPGRRAK